MDPGQWVKSLNDYVLATVCVALAVAVVSLFKALMVSKAETAAKGKEKEDVLREVLPIAIQLGHSVEALERMTERRGGP